MSTSSPSLRGPRPSEAGSFAPGEAAGPSHLGFADEADVDRFVEMLERFENGEIAEPEWRAFRLVHGTYGQRQGTSDSMLRAKLPQGVVTHAGLLALADVADRHSRGFCHVTTRQNVQFHFLPLHEMEDAMRTLAAAGITTKEACGNAVRNITTGPTSGVAADEAFDVRPYAEALTRFLLRHPLSSTLPRKFKMSFTGGGADHAFAAVNDIGFHARIVPTEDGGARRAFRVTVAGGTATVCASGQTLFDDLHPREILGVALAVLRVFDALGDRVNRHKNRMKFLVRKLGWEAFRGAVLDEIALVREAGMPRLPFDPEEPPVEGPPDRARERLAVPAFADLALLVKRTRVKGPGIVPRHLPVVAAEARWRQTNVRPQRQRGYSIVTVTLPLGDVTSGQLRALAWLGSSIGEGDVRFTPNQNAAIRWVPDDLVSALYQRLHLVGLGRPDADTFADAVSCPGAETCKLAVTQSRGLGALVSDHFAGQSAWIDRAPGLTVRISGCPNGCSLHHLAGIGLQGGMRKVGGRAVPQYFVMVGGGIDGDRAHFARLSAKVPARRVPAVIERLITFWERTRLAGESITAFLRRADVKAVKAELADLEILTEEDARPEHFVDLGETEDFRPEAGEGECAA